MKNGLKTKSKREGRIILSLIKESTEANKMKKETILSRLENL